MRAPRGFGKNYFSLASIQAHSSAVTLQAKALQSYRHVSFCLQDIDQDELTSPPDELSLLDISKDPDSQSRRHKPCFCNHFFKQKSRNALKLAYLNQAPLCKCRKTKSGIAPPYDLLFLTKLYYLI